MRGGGRNEPSDVDEFADVLVLFSHDHTARKTEIAIEPGVPKSTPVRLHRELFKLLRLLLVLWLEPETGAVGVGGHDAEAVSCFLLLLLLLSLLEDAFCWRLIDILCLIDQAAKRERRQIQTYCWPTEKAKREDWLRVKK